MKKLVVVLFVALVAMSVSAQTIQLGNFPVGQWLDHNYNAIWEFSSNNIRILGTNGAVLHDFSNYTIQNFRVFMEGTQPGISFTCPDTARSYRFIKPLSNSDLVMEIDREGRPSYSVTQRQWTGQLPTPPATAGSGVIPDGMYVTAAYDEGRGLLVKTVYVFSGNTLKAGNTSDVNKRVLELSDIEFWMEGTYTVRNGVIYANIDNEIREFPYTLVGNRLTFPPDGVFTRQ